MTAASPPSMSLEGIHLDRRSALSLGSLFAAALAATPLTTVLTGCAPHSRGPNDHTTLVLDLLDIVIPATDTPGAGTMANMAFVLKAVGTGLMNAPLDTLDRLEEDLDTRAGTRFVDLPQDRQHSLLVAHDKDVFGSPIAFPSPWFTTKALILMGYYTSETGASQELTYELVPGRLDPDIAVDANWKPMMNDWAANSIKKAIAG